jgi:hypothetical protein
MDLNKELVFLPVSDLELFGDWDNAVGYGGVDCIAFECDGVEGIIVSKEREDDWKEHVKEFENRN